jgi:hypothetical protein
MFATSTLVGYINVQFLWLLHSVMYMELLLLLVVVRIPSTANNNSSFLYSCYRINKKSINDPMKVDTKYERNRNAQ